MMSAEVINQSTPNVMNESSVRCLKELSMDDHDSISVSDSKRLKLDCLKSDSVMQKNILKRLRVNFDNMTRDDLEELITIKICEIIINNSEFNELRTTVENQSKIIKTYKEQLVSLIKQYEDIKLINKYLTMAIKSNNNKILQPLRINRTVAIQHDSPSAPLLLNVPNNGTNIKIVQSPPTAQKQTVIPRTVQKTTPPKLVVVNSGNSVLNLCDNKSNMKSSKIIVNKVLNNQANIFRRSPRRLSNKEDQVLNTSQKNGNNTPNVSQSNVLINKKQNNSPENNAVTSTQQSNVIDLTEEDDDAPVQANRQSNTNGNLPPLVVFQNEARSGVQSTKNNQQQLSIVQGSLKSTTWSSSIDRTKGPNRIICLPPLPKAVNRIIANSRPIPPAPVIQVEKAGNGVNLKWDIHADLSKFETIIHYQIFACQGGNSQILNEWQHVDNVVPLKLPIVVGLTEFESGCRYFFTVRAVDRFSRTGNCSVPRSVDRDIS